jgi:nicotinamide riboside transporter PnuC
MEKSNKIIAKLAETSKIGLAGVLAGVFCIVFSVVYTVICYSKKR